jgi:hypothetical protein
MSRPELAVWFKLESVDLENNEDANWFDGDEVQVAVRWTFPPPAKPTYTMSDVRAVQELIRTKGPYKANVQGKPWAAEAIAEVMKLDLSIPVQRTYATDLLKEWMGQGWLVEKWGRDEHARRDKKMVEPGSAPPYEATRPATGDDQ